MIGITAVFPVELPVALDDLAAVAEQPQRPSRYEPIEPHQDFGTEIVFERWHFVAVGRPDRSAAHRHAKLGEAVLRLVEIARHPAFALHRSEEHTSELQSLMRISSAVFCLKKKKKIKKKEHGPLKVGKNMNKD